MEKVNYSMIEAFGDSLTQGTGGTSYVTQLAWRLAPRVIANHGIGGQTMEQIACRLGASPIKVSLSGAAFNGTSSVVVTPEVLFLSTAADTVTRYSSGILNGVPCVITCDGATDTYAIIPGHVASTTVVRNGSIFYPDTAFNSKDSIQLLWLGRNNLPTVTGLDIIYERAIANLSEPKRYIIIGLLNSLTEITGNATYNAMVSMNNTLRAKFTDNYVEATPPSSEEMLELAYTPDAQDLADIANNTIPTGMRADNIHLNTIGYALIAMRVYKKGVELGYF